MWNVYLWTTEVVGWGGWRLSLGWIIGSEIRINNYTSGNTGCCGSFTPSSNWFIYLSLCWSPYTAKSKYCANFKLFDACYGERYVFGYANITGTYANSSSMDDFNMNQLIPVIKGHLYCYKMLGCAACIQLIISRDWLVMD